MKMNIYDIMDSYDGNSDDTTLNENISQDVKNSIMDKVKSKKIIKHSKKMIAAIIAAAALLCISITVYAASENWFGLLFTSYDDDKNYSIPSIYMTDTSCAAVISDGDVKIELLGTSPLPNGMAFMLKVDAGHERQLNHIQSIDWADVIIDGVNVNDSQHINLYYSCSGVYNTKLYPDDYSNYPLYDYLNETEFISMIYIIGSRDADINGKTAEITLNFISDYDNSSGELIYISKDTWSFELGVKTTGAAVNTESIELRSYAPYGNNYGTASITYLSPVYSQIVLEWNAETFFKNWMGVDDLYSDFEADFDYNDFMQVYQQIAETIVINTKDGNEYKTYRGSQNIIMGITDKNGNLINSTDGYDLSELKFKIYIDVFTFHEGDDIETLSILGQKLPYSE